MRIGAFYDKYISLNRKLNLVNVTQDIEEDNEIVLVCQGAACIGFNSLTKFICECEDGFYPLLIGFTLHILCSLFHISKNDNYDIIFFSIFQLKSILRKYCIIAVF